jgi:hypothetical protein
MFRRKIDGVTTLVTRVSHGESEIGPNLATAMAHQCALRLAEFERLVDCALSSDEWDAIVRERCASGRNPFLCLRPRHRPRGRGPARRFVPAASPLVVPARAALVALGPPVPARASPVPVGPARRLRPLRPPAPALAVRPCAAVLSPFARSPLAFSTNVVSRDIADRCLGDVNPPLNACRVAWTFPIGMRLFVGSMQRWVSRPAALHGR